MRRARTIHNYDLCFDDFEIVVAGGAGVDLGKVV
jgi:hypothetical protein